MKVVVSLNDLIAWGWLLFALIMGIIYTLFVAVDEARKRIRNRRNKK